MNIIEIIAKTRIHESIERGEFEDLNGRGLPVDLNAYFKTPPNLRIVYALLKNARIDVTEIKFTHKSVTQTNVKCPVALLGSLTTILVIPIFNIGIQYEFIIPEEIAIAETFGQEFQNYKRQTRRWL